MRRILVVLLVVVSFGAHAAEAPDNVDGAMTVNVFQAKRLHELGAVFIDVRADREWLWGHVEGAVHFDLASDFVSLAGPEWPRELPLVIYCDSEVCPRSWKRRAWLSAGVIRGCSTSARAILPGSCTISRRSPEKTGRPPRSMPRPTEQRQIRR